MRKLFAVFALLAISGIPTLAQDKPLFEVNGGYTFLDWQKPPIPILGESDYLHYNGFNVGGAVHFTSIVSLALDLTGTYNSSGPFTRIYSYLVGPRLYPIGHHKLTPYIHGLAGAATFVFPADFGPSETKFSFEVGGGVDWAVGKHLAIRLGQFDYQQTRFLHSEEIGLNAPPNNQDNFKYSAGVVLRFGEK